MAQKIFIVEDDAVIAKTISDYLNRWALPSARSPSLTKLTRKSQRRHQT